MKLLKSISTFYLVSTLALLSLFSSVNCHTTHHQQDKCPAPSNGTITIAQGILQDTIYLHWKSPEKEPKVYNITLQDNTGTIKEANITVKNATSYRYITQKKLEVGSVITGSISAKCGNTISQPHDFPAIVVVGDPIATINILPYYKNDQIRLNICNITSPYIVVKYVQTSGGSNILFNRVVNVQCACNCSSVYGTAGFINCLTEAAVSPCIH